VARYNVSRTLPYTPEQLFELVADVAKYPEFIPWITHMRVSNERVEPEGIRALDAEAAVGFSFLRERFGTRVRRDPAAHVIDVSLLSGPFRKLENRWRFTSEGPGPGSTSPSTSSSRSACSMRCSAPTSTRR
jgi:coenzyme Q-binding protein COQ10